MENKEVKVTNEVRKRIRDRSLDGWLPNAQNFIATAMDTPSIADRLARFGYTRARMEEGKALVEATLGTMLEQKRQYGERYEATDILGTTFGNAVAAYTKTLKIARIALGDLKEARAAMMVDGARNRSRSGSLIQIEAFYGNLLKDDDALRAMDRFGYTADTLLAEYRLARDVSAAWVKAQKETGEAYGATRERDRKFDEAARWVSDLRAVCKVAFADEPGNLKTLGLVR